MKRRDFLFLLTAPALALRGVQEIVCTPTFSLPYTPQSFALGYTITGKYVEDAEHARVMTALLRHKMEKDAWNMLDIKSPTG